MSAQVEVVPQHQLTAVAGLSEEQARARLLLVVWAAPKDDAGNIVGPPGLHDLRGTRRTMIVNDLTRHGIKAEVRLASLDLLRAVTGDDTATTLVVKGPTEASYVPGDIPWVDYTLTAEWQSVPAIFASWLDYRRAETRTLGASYVAQRRERVEAAGGEVVHRWVQFATRAVDLFEFRLPGDVAGRLVTSGSAPTGSMATPGPDRAEMARLQAMVLDLQRTVAHLASPGEIAGQSPLDVRPRDDLPGPGETVTMAGGAYLAMADSGPVGADDGEAYEPGDGAAAAELAAVVRAAGGGSAKARRAGA